MSHTLESLPVSEIDLDQKNPRFEPTSSQQSAIETMVNSLGEKIYKLASDIAEFGLDPSKRLIIFKENGKYIDGDGNRRITAIKLLDDPELIKDSALYEKFLKLSKTRKTTILNVDCAIFKNRSSIKHWLEINHDGQQDGKGLMPWGTAEKERFTGKKSTALLGIEKLIEEGIIRKSEAKQVSLTTLSRFTDSQIGKEYLSIEVGPSNTTFGDLDRLATLFERLKGVHVREVYTKNEFEPILVNLFGKLKKNKPQQQKTSKGKPQKNNTANNRRTPRSKRENSVIFGEPLFLKAGKINDIYRDICEVFEISRENRFGTHVEILGFSMRLILDVAAHEYYKINPVSGQNSDSVYLNYIKLLKQSVPQKSKNTLTIDTAISSLINEPKVEALFAKLAHGSVDTSIDTVLNLSMIVGPILQIHFRKCD